MKLFNRKPKLRKNVVAKVVLTEREVWDALEALAIKKAEGRNLDLSGASAIRISRLHDSWSHTVKFMEEFDEREARRPKKD